MAEQAPKVEDRPYRDWLADALARDQETWDALERMLKRIKAAADKPRPTQELAAKRLDW
jgi:hypothetical protein